MPKRSHFNPLVVDMVQRNGDRRRLDYNPLLRMTPSQWSKLLKAVENAMAEICAENSATLDEAERQGGARGDNQ